MQQLQSRDIARLRLVNQQIAHTHFSQPEQLVQWMGCIQSQDFAGAKWAIGSRLNGITEVMIDRLFNEGKILRTHILRPTWHFVLPEDIDWIRRLTAPKIKAFNKVLYQKLGINERILTRSKDIIARALTGGQQRTREQLMQLLKKARINTDDIRSNFLMMDAELDGIICSGARQGKQFTYALLEERVPPQPQMSTEAAIAALAQRYFISRGPATLQDFAWWSGLTLSQAKAGIEMNQHQLASEVINGQAYWFSANLPIGSKPANAIHLLPAFDEYTVAYKDRSDVLKPAYHAHCGNGIFKPVIVINGQITGIWKRTEKKKAVEITIQPCTTLSKQSQLQIRKTAQKYASFTGRELSGVENTVAAMADHA